MQMSHVFFREIFLHMSNINLNMIHCLNVIIVDSAACSDVKSDVVFLLDSSSTICTQLSGSTCANWNNVLSLVSRIVDKMNIGPNQVQVGLLTFDSTVNSVFKLNTYNRWDRFLLHVSNLIQ